MKLIIMAGGQGTKLWPYSTSSKPKQFQKIIGQESLFTNTVNTLLKRFSPEDVFVSTKKKYVGLAINQAPTIPLKNYIVEPNTANGRGPGEGFVFLTMSIKHPNEPFMLIQPDCYRDPVEKFLDMIEAQEKLLIKDKKMITGGIKATYPMLGVDYIRLGDKLNQSSDLDIYSATEFVDRSDDYYKTKDLVENFHIVTHSNHCSWYPELMLNAYKKYHPTWYKSLMQIKDVFGTTNEEEKIEEIYKSMPKGNTEEVTKHLFKESYIVVLPFKWIDLGTWNSVYKFFADSDKPYLDGKNIIAIDSKKSMIKTDSNQRLIATVGLEDFVVIDTKEVLLILPRDKSDSISKIRKELAKKDLDSYL